MFFVGLTLAGGVLGIAASMGLLSPVSLFAIAVDAKNCDPDGVTVSATTVTDGKITSVTVSGIHDACLDGVCVTFLLRYVDDPEATLREIVRVLKPGGRLTYLEFGVPENRIARILWYAYTRGVLPLAGALVSPGWRKVGSFLGPSISRLYQSYPETDLRDIWVTLGMQDVRVKHLSLGGGVVMWGTKSG